MNSTMAVNEGIEGAGTPNKTHLKNKDQGKDQDLSPGQDKPGAPPSQGPKSEASIDATTSDIEDQGHRLIDDLLQHEPHTFTERLKSRQFWIQQSKTAFAVAITSLTFLVEDLNTLFYGTGGWATLTVVIIVLATPGATTHKLINRFVGTLISAMLAGLVGFIGVEISRSSSPAGKLVVGISNVVFTFIGVMAVAKGGQWSYAVLFGTATYTFMVAAMLEDDFHVPIFRVATISLGAIVGFVIAWLPPRVQATEAVRAYLADALIDTGVCAELVVDRFLKGQVLKPIEDIYAGEKDDTFHKLSKTIQTSREKLESAVQASKYESRRAFEGLSAYGLAIRLALRPLISADALLRQEYTPLDLEIESHAKLADALKLVGKAIRRKFLEKVPALNCRVPSELQNGEENALDINAALQNLKDNLQVYIESHTELQSVSIMSGAACHVAFAKLLHDTGVYAQRVNSDILPQHTRDSIFSFKELDLQS